MHRDLDSRASGTQRDSSGLRAEGISQLLKAGGLDLVEAVQRIRLRLAVSGVVQHSKRPIRTERIPQSEVQSLARGDSDSADSELWPDR